MGLEPRGTCSEAACLTAAEWLRRTASEDTRQRGTDPDAPACALLTRAHRRQAHVLLGSFEAWIQAGSARSISPPGLHAGHRPSRHAVGSHPAAGPWPQWTFTLGDGTPSSRRSSAKTALSRSAGAILQAGQSAPPRRPGPSARAPPHSPRRPFLSGRDHRPPSRSLCWFDGSSRRWGAGAREEEGGRGDARGCPDRDRRSRRPAAASARSTRMRGASVAWRPHGCNSTIHSCQPSRARSRVVPGFTLRRRAQAAGSSRPHSPGIFRWDQPPLGHSHPRDRGTSSPVFWTDPGARGPRRCS